MEVSRRVGARRGARPGHQGGERGRQHSRDGTRPRSGPGRVGLGPRWAWRRGAAAGTGGARGVAAAAGADVSGAGRRVRLREEGEKLGFGLFGLRNSGGDTNI